jgi:hypothetical protein
MAASTLSRNEQRHDELSQKYERSCGSRRGCMTTLHGHRYQASAYKVVDESPSESRWSAIMKGAFTVQLGRPSL